MKRLLLLGTSLVLGIIAAAQLPAKEPGQNQPRHSRETRQVQSNIKLNQNFSGPSRSMPSFSGNSKKVGIGNVQPTIKPFKPITPVSPIIGKPGLRPIGPIQGGSGIPVKPIDKPIVKPFHPIKPIDKPIVKPWPIKPIQPIKPIDGPIVKPWPVKPIHQPHHHHHCEPHWYKPCYSWLWYGHNGAGCYVVSKPVIVEVPIIVNQVEQLPEVQVGATITLPAQTLGDQAGVVMLRVGDITLGAMVNEWTNTGVQLTLPMVGLEQPKRAEIVVLLPDGQVAMTVPVKLIPAVPPQQP